VRIKPLNSCKDSEGSLCQKQVLYAAILARLHVLLVVLDLVLWSVVCVMNIWNWHLPIPCLDQDFSLWKMKGVSHSLSMASLSWMAASPVRNIHSMV